MQLGNRIAAPAFVHTHKVRWQEPMRAGLTIGADGKMAFNPPYYVADEEKKEASRLPAEAKKVPKVEEHAFRVGDKVMVNDKCSLVFRRGHFGVVVKPLRADRVSVQLDDDDLIRHLRASSLNLIAEPGLPFKIGDRVMVNDTCAVESRRGKTGRVESVSERKDPSDGTVQVSVLLGDGVTLVGFRSTSLDLIDAQPKQRELEVGDRVMVTCSGSSGIISEAGNVGVQVAMDDGRGTLYFARTSLTLVQ